MWLRCAVLMTGNGPFRGFPVVFLWPYDNHRDSENGPIWVSQRSISWSHIVPMRRAPMRHPAFALIAHNIKTEFAFAALDLAQSHVKFARISRCNPRLQCSGKFLIMLFREPNSVLAAMNVADAFSVAYVVQLDDHIASARGPRPNGTVGRSEISFRNNPHCRLSGRMQMRFGVALAVALAPFCLNLKASAK